MELLNTLRQRLIALNLANPRIAIALSGGRDSVALLHAACSLRATVPFQLRAIHIHHGLSAHATDWAQFCAALCAKLNVAHTQIAVQVDRTNAAGVEAHARAARYQAFTTLDVDAILLAHHADDQIETSLHRLFRGAGLTGLAGMQATRPLKPSTQLLRPWLEINRAQIEAYVAENKLEFIEDESNTNTQHTRNFLRNEILPSLQQHFPQVKQAVAHMAQHAQEHAQFAEALAQIDLGLVLDKNGLRSPKIGHLQGIDLMNIEALITLPLARQTNALYYFLHWQGITKFNHAELCTWAKLLFCKTEDIKRDRPARAGGHHVVITRKRKGLWVRG